MILSRRLVLMFPVMAAALALAASPASGSAATSARCSDVVIRTGDGSVYTRTRRLVGLGVTCATVRRVARIYLTLSEGADPVRPLGYRCSTRSDGGAVSCKRGTRIVRWSY